VRKKRRRYTLPNMALDKLPSPDWVATPTAQRPWRVHMSGVGGMGIGLVGAILVRAGHKEGYHVQFSEKKGLAIRNGGVFSQVVFQPREAPETTALIPYGQADLLLGVDVLEAARAVDPRDVFRVADAQRTAAVVNTYKQSTILTLLGREDFDPEALREAIFAKCNASLSYANDLSMLCERRLGSKQFVNIMVLGVAFQLGLIPVSSHAIAWAIKDSIKRDHRRNLKAFNIGRKLALEPRKLAPRPQPATWEQVVTSKLRLIRRNGASAKKAAEFERLAHFAVRQLKNISEQAKYDIVVRVYELVNYGGIAYAKRYTDLVRDLYHRDSSGRQYAATHAAITNLAKVMLIKDEPYVAWLLTRPEKIERDIEKYNLDVANGDRLIYEHYTSPEIPVGPWRLRLKLKTRNWQLKLMRRLKIVRRLPNWHRREKAFMQWYIELLGKADLAGDVAYQKWLRILRCPESVSGYREIRYPKMAAAMREVDELAKREQPSSPGVPVA
jgi:indolepyruvate ferredoxin oxidoreductase